jgi:hypothetical protein
VVGPRWHRKAMEMYKGVGERWYDGVSVVVIRW